VTGHDRNFAVTTRGRPRSDQSRQAILQSALDLVAEIGYSRVTIEGIAARAGTGKQTIYRWWRSKADVVLDAINASATREIPIPDTGSLREDLLAFLNATFAAGRRPGTVPVLQALMAEAQLDPDFGAAFDEKFLRQRREALAEVLRRYPGELRDVPPKIAIEVVFGVLWYRILATRGPLNATLARELTTLLTG
jgi:AcrR family transcriptional regulator